MGSPRHKSFALSREQSTRVVHFSEKGFVMKKVTLSVFALSLVFLATGCGDSPDAVMKDTIKLMNEAADALDSAKDKDSAEKAKTKLEEIEKKFKDVVERAKKMKVSEEKGKQLAEKYKDDMEKVQKRMIEVSINLAKNPEAANIV